MKKFLVSAIFISAIIITPNFSGAVTSSDLEARINALSKQIKELQRQTRRTERSEPVKLFAVEEVRQSILTFNRNLYYGMKNNQDVSDLQEFLTDQGYYAGPISGNFGLLTSKAVKKFQSANGIKPTGYFGTRSRAVANEIMQKLVEQICPEEEGCEDDKLPVEKLFMTADSDLSGAVGEQLAIGFKVFGGSGNYNIQVIDGGVPGLNICEEKDCSKDKIILSGAPTETGVFSVTFLAKDISEESYVKERFTIVIKDKNSRRNPPVIHGIKGPTVLKTGEEGLWTIEASDANNGSLNYRVVWGDEVYREESVKEFAPRAIPFRQTAVFSHIYYREGVYNPTFYVVNDRGAEAKTSVSVNVEGKEKIVSEQVKCVFNNSSSEQKCYTATNDYYNDETIGCSGKTTCVADIKGTRGDKITWKSACGGYAFTEMDGNNEYAEFNCAEPFPPQPSITVLSPNGGERWQIGSVQTINWKVSGDIPLNWTKNPNGIADVIIYLYKGEQFIQYVSTWHSGGPAGFTVPDVAPGDDYKIKISARGSGDIDLKYYDLSDSPFSIVALISTTPSITVRSPNGGERWAKGTTHEIIWATNIASYPNLSNAPVTISLTNVSTGQVYTITSNAINTGSYLWEISNCTAANPCSSNFDFPAPGSYTIQVCQAGTNACDSSNSSFTITTPTTQPSIINSLPQTADVLFMSGVKAGERRREIYALDTNSGSITRITLSNKHQHFAGIDNSRRYIVSTQSDSELRNSTTPVFHRYS